MATVRRRGTVRRRYWPGLLTAAYLCTFLLWINGMFGCAAGQRPINLGGTKKRDVYIAGFFPYGSHVPESHIGRGVMPSVKLAVDHINEDRTVLRNYRLHMWWNDTEVRLPSIRKNQRTEPVCRVNNFVELLVPFVPFELTSKRDLTRFINFCYMHIHRVRAAHGARSITEKPIMHKVFR